MGQIILDEVQISVSLVWRILHVHEQLLYSYHVQRIQALIIQHVWFFTAGLYAMMLKTPVFSNILFTNEAGFTRNKDTLFVKNLDGYRKLQLSKSYCFTKPINLLQNTMRDLPYLQNLYFAELCLCLLRVFCLFWFILL